MAYWHFFHFGSEWGVVVVESIMFNLSYTIFLCLDYVTLKTLLLPSQMNCMSQLPAIGEGDFFVSCLLHLSPEDLKACRLVNKTWARVIKEGVWGNKRARKTL